MKFIIFVLFLSSTVNSQISYVDYGNDGLSNHRSNPRGRTDISLSNNVGYSKTSNGGNAAVNSIIISGYSNDQNKPRNDVNSVRINGQNGASNGPLNIVLSNNHGVAEDIRSGSFGSSFPNFNSYPQNNFHTNTRPQYYPVNPQTAPVYIRPSIQYPDIKNSLNNQNSDFKGITNQYGGLSNPYAFLFGR
ncbi:hypothetical protein ACKWTF_004516 [Chironomus riparius]